MLVESCPDLLRETKEDRMSYTAKRLVLFGVATIGLLALAARLHRGGNTHG
jgi:hypothetical protein